MEKMGFEGLLTIPNDIMWKGELKEAFYCVKSDEWKFMVPGSNVLIELGPQIVEDLLHLKNEGLLVPSDISDADAESELVNSWKTTKFSAMEEILRTQNPDSDEWRSTFLIYTLSKYLAAANKNGVQVHLFAAALLFKTSEMYNWAEYVWRVLQAGIEKFRKDKMPHYCGGCTHVLLVSMLLLW